MGQRPAPPGRGEGPRNGNRAAGAELRQGGGAGPGPADLPDRGAAEAADQAGREGPLPTAGDGGGPGGGGAGGLRAASLVGPGPGGGPRRPRPDLVGRGGGRGPRAAPRRAPGDAARPRGLAAPA